MQSLLTARLRLEPLMAAHADLLFAGLSDPRLYDYIPEPPPASVEVLRERYRRLESRLSPDSSEEWLNWLVSLRDPPRALGYVQATVYDDTSAEVAYVLLRDAWGAGYGREATAAMIDHLHTHAGVRRFRATVDPRNRASVRLLEALGFTRVALLAADDAEYQLRR
jgi:ribosomal-protein-alanine N-acetyltransferase